MSHGFSGPCSFDAQDSARQIALPGVSIGVQVHGAEPFAVFVHGLAGDRSGWDALCALLPCERGHVRYDLRGHGTSHALNDAPFHDVDDLLALLDALGVARCDLVGASLGGAISLNFALSHPGRVRSLALMGPAITAWEWSPEWLATWRPIVALAQAGDMAGAKMSWLAHPLFETVPQGPIRERLRQEIFRHGGGGWTGRGELPALPDLERLHTLDLPVLLLGGGRDLADFRLIADLVEACIPGVERHEAAAHGHMLSLEAPEWCRDRLVAFWNRISALGGGHDRGS